MFFIKFLDRIIDCENQTLAPEDSDCNSESELNRIHLFEDVDQRRYRPPVFFTIKLEIQIRIHFS